VRRAEVQVPDIQTAFAAADDKDASLATKVVVP